MAQLLEFFPLIVFFGAYKLADIYAATGALIIASIMQVGIMRWRGIEIRKQHWITLVLVIVFGALTLFFRNDLFIKWKVTAIYGLLGGGLLISQLMFKKSLFESMMGKELPLPKTIFAKLSIGWGVFFCACAVLNVYIAYNFPQDTWVNFKVFGLTVLSFAGMIATGVYIWRYLPEDFKQSQKS